MGVVSLNVPFSVRMLKGRFESDKELVWDKV